MDIEESKQDIVLLGQGAEGRVFKQMFLGEMAVVKERYKREYRNPILDAKLTNQRTISEARNLNRARKAGVNTPYVMLVDTDTNKIYLQYVKNSMTVKQYFVNLHTQNKEFPESVLKMIGTNVALLHDNDLVHGDLTTSNMLLKFDEYFLDVEKATDYPNKFSYKDACFYVIDFGLSYVSTNPEDKAVDLYVLEKAFLSTHTEYQAQLDIILETYKTTSKKGPATIARLDEVRKRGRKKLAFG